VVAVGARAAWLTEEHPADDAYDTEHGAFPYETLGLGEDAFAVDWMERRFG
jgi:hypothetical protein